MEKKTIKEIYGYESSQFFLVILVTTIILIGLIICVYIIFPYEQFLLVFPIIIIIYITINKRKVFAFYCLCKARKFLEKTNKVETEILWWNNNNCFLIKDKVIVVKRKVVDFNYLDIESIQKEKIKSRYYTIGNPLEYTYINFMLRNGKQYKTIMFNTNAYFYPYNDIKDITNLLLENNPKISIKEEILHQAFDRIA